MNGTAAKRGALIVFEGCDRSGKTTQCKMLVEKLWELGFTAQQMRFPDRSTATGRIIDNYLTRKEELPDQAIHLLFSANRWESEPKMKSLLNEGVTLVIDRYCYSGVAYTSAKQGLDFDWCRQPEAGLPKPDLVILLKLVGESQINREGYGDEVYDKQQFQEAVYKNFMKLEDNSWKVIDCDRSIQEIHEEIVPEVTQTIDQVKALPMEHLW